MEALDAFDAALDGLEEQLAPLLDTPLSLRRQQAATPLDAARVDLVHAYALNSLMFMFLKTRGLNTDSHVIKAELERLRGYFAKVEAAGEDPPPDKRKTKINVPAAGRFIKAALDKDPPSGRGGKATKKRPRQG